jgi:putative ubiquitin-RnfH superfamily antitoxin RatB of RatAB toxin-antitoxin module
MAIGEHGFVSDTLLQIEVAYALPHQQKIISLSVPAQTTLYQAVVLSNITAYFPQLNLETATFGVFSKLEKSPKTRMVQAGDRIEIYRPLLVDPKEARKARAAKVQEKSSFYKGSALKPLSLLKIVVGL